MKKNLTLLIFVFFLIQNTFAQFTLEVRITGGSATGYCDNDGVLNDSDAAWAAWLTNDGIGNSQSINDQGAIEVGGNNGPNISTSQNSTFWSRTYDNCNSTPDGTGITVRWFGVENEDVAWPPIDEKDANDMYTGENTVVMSIPNMATSMSGVWQTPTINSGTLTDQAQPGGNCNPFYTIQFEVRFIGPRDCPNTCAGAIDLTPPIRPGCGSSPQQSLWEGMTFDFEDITTISPSGVTPAPSCGNFNAGTYQDAWFKATIPADRYGLDFLFSNDGGCGAVCSTNITYSVYSGSCGALALESCDQVDCPAGVCSGKKISVFGDPGETLYIRMWEEDNQGFEFSINGSNVQGICEVPYDDCPVADVLQTPGEFVCQSTQPTDSIVTSGLPTYSYTNANGIRPSPSLNNIGSDKPDCWWTADQPTREDFWISAVIADNSGGVQVQFQNNGGCDPDPGNAGSCQTNFAYSWYTSSDGSCTGLEYRGCGTVSCFVGCGDGQINVDGRPGETVWIRIWEEENQGGEIVINEIVSTAPADKCYSALPLGPNGCNYEATNIAPDGQYDEDANRPAWTSFAHPGQACQDGDGDPGTNTVWSSNENLVWYTFTHGGGDFYLQADDVSCTGSPATVQMGVFSMPSSGDLCDFDGGGANGSTGASGVQGYGCTVGVGTTVLDILALPPGDYVLLVDGNAGSECVWTFKDELGNPLPVELMTLKANYIPRQRKVQVSWVTAEEFNNLGFEVHRSLDGRNFEEIGFVEAILAPNQNDFYIYEFNDFEYPIADVVYYRLKQIDIDGSFNITKHVTTSTLDGVKGIALLKNVYPNPTYDMLNIPFITEKDATVTIELYDMTGRRVMNIANGIDFNRGEHKIEVNLNSMSPGIYALRFIADNEVYTQKVVLK